MYAGIHHYSILHDVRELTIVGREWYRPSTAGQCSCARLHRDYTSYTTTFSIAARPYASPVCGHTAPKELVAVSVSVAGQLQTPPPSIERSFQVYLTQRTVQLKRRHSNSNAILKCRSGRPDIRSFSLITPETPTHNTPSQRQPPSTLTQLLSTSIPLPSPASPRAPGEDLDSYHVRAIYAALGVSGIRGTAMKMTGSCKTGEQQQSYSAAAF